MPTVIPILYNIRSTHNVGSILRTAECAGVTEAYLTGYTPAPTDRFGRTRDDIAKVALGAEDLVEWKRKDDIIEVIADLRQQGVRIVALEQHERAVSYISYTPADRTAVVLGEEVKGIPNNIIDLCDDVVEIPLYGEKESLNVSVAAGIVLFRLIQK